MRRPGPLARELTAQRLNFKRPDANADAHGTDATTQRPAYR
jgi:hypothetical protein